MLWLTKLSLRRPVTLAMALASVVLLGAVSIAKLPLDFLPRVEFPFIAVFIPYQGGIPSENEREIVRPIEEVLATLGDVEGIFSHSDANNVQVGVRFAWGRDVNLLRMERAAISEPVADATDPQLCPRCGADVAPDSRFCAQCGIQLIGPESAAGAKAE